ncbi:MAG: NAD+ synthase [Candidatus Asgardarchaeum sp.]
MISDEDPLLKIDPESVKKRIVSEIRNYFSKHNLKNSIIGLSGGVDSSLTAFLLVESLGPERVKALILPSNITSEEDINDAKRIASILKIDYTVISITPIVEAFKNALNVNDKIAIGNIMARTRMIILYNEARQQKGLVVGTGNKTELMVGYFTKYGDGGVDILPIGDLYKTQVWALAEYAGVPQRIIKKVPTAGLWIGQTDEGELGIKYRLLDRILVRLIDYKMTYEEIMKEVNVEREIIDKVSMMVKNSEHKRQLPYIIKIK